MRWIKKYFAVIFLFISCLAVGILALVTAIRVRELRTATPPQTQALTPPCSLTFVINDTTPRETENEPTKIAEILITPTLTPLPTPTSIPATPTLLPTPTSKPTATPTLSSLTPTPTAAYGYGSYPNLTLTPTPALIAQTKITNTPTPTLLAKPTLNNTITPTRVEPELPVSGISLPTWLTVIVGLVFLTTARFLFLREK